MWDMPANPSVNEVSELVFQLKQAFDNFVVAVLQKLIDADLARLLGVFISVNVLAGFVAAIYAAVISTVVRKLENVTSTDAASAADLA